MSDIQFLKNRFQEHQTKTAMIWNNNQYTYAWFLQAIGVWQERIKEEKVGRHSVVGLNADFSPNAVALLLALIEHGSVVVPLTESVRAKRAEYTVAAEININFSISADDSYKIERLDNVSSHDLYQNLWARRRPGLVLFSSGSTGASKAILHDFKSLLEKFEYLRQPKCIMTFLLFDHIGGINTLLHTLSNLGTVVTVPDRSPKTVCSAIDKYKVQILPASPTFLNLMLLSGAIDQHNLSSLETVTYGTEVMPESVLKRFHQKFPHIKLLQTYGLSEVGILRSKSESSESLWVRIGGEGFQTRVVDGLLEIKATSAMLGYLNAPSPFTTDGWLKTGDMVEEKDGFYRILGRKSELINVGGEKVFPAEVESVLQQMEGVEDVCVYGEPNAITGNMIVAKMRLSTDESLAEVRKRMIIFCRDLLPVFKIPQKVHISDENLYGERFKKVRSNPLNP